MNFVSFSFLLLLSVTLIVRFFCYKRDNIYKKSLVGFSIIFYGWFVPEYVILLLISSTIDYIAGQKIYRLQPETKQRKKLLKKP